VTTRPGSCQILHLVLGPLDLDILGLRVQLSRIVLDITAQRGPGNLLGNLLCGIAGLLNGNRLNAVADRLNNVLELSRALSNLPVRQTIAGVGTFAGTFDIQRFARRGDNLVAIGTLTGTFTNLAGETANVTRTVTATVTRGTCQILHLELGPLDLDLLGLQIHLDKVVLNITAQAGPGNLLGNLLCAIARLLDGNGSLDSLIDRLNRLVVVRA
jgi:hypothetical protein